MYNFDFNIANNAVPTLRLSASMLTFNLACANILENPQFVSIGLDREKKLLAVKPSNNDNNSQCFEFLSKNNKTISIKSFALQKEILKTGIEIPRLDKKTIGKFDENEKLLIFCL